MTRTQNPTGIYRWPGQQTIMFINQKERRESVVGRERKKCLWNSVGVVCKIWYLLELGKSESRRDFNLMLIKYWYFSVPGICFAGLSGRDTIRCSDCWLLGLVGGNVFGQIVYELISLRFFSPLSVCCAGCAYRCFFFIAWFNDPVHFLGLFCAFFSFRSLQ